MERAAVASRSGLSRVAGTSSPAFDLRLASGPCRDDGQTFGSRRLHQSAIKRHEQRRLSELEQIGIIARARSRRELPEEQPKAYKDVDAVVDVVHNVGLSRKVARFRPIGVIKG